MSEIINTKEYLDKFKERKIIDFNNPSCNNCSECCCITASLTEEEFRFFKKFFKSKEGKIIFKEAKEKYNNRYKNNALDLRCYFLSSKKKCKIYKFRPQVCRDFHCKESLRKKEYTDVDLRTGYSLLDLFEDRKGDYYEYIK